MRVAKKLIAFVLAFAMAFTGFFTVDTFAKAGAAETNEVPEITVKSTASEKIPMGGIIYNGHYYYKYEEYKISWSAAEAFCEDVGGHLVTITSELEQGVVEQLIASSDQYWIGASRDDDFNWSWVTGEKWDYVNWAYGQPVNREDEKYLQISEKQWVSSKMAPSYDSYGFVCEWDDVNTLNLPSSTIDVTTISVPKNVEKYNSHYYAVCYDYQISWLAAKTYCERMGGHLATITSIGEDGFIERLINSSNRFWIGGSRNEYFSWSWITGEEWDYVNWASGEPTDRDDEKYLRISNKQWVSSKMAPSYESYGFVCEWDNASYVENSFQKITVKTAKKTIKASSLKTKKVSFNIGAKAKSSLSYSVDGENAQKYISVNEKGKVVVKKGTPKGTYKIIVTAAETDEYNEVQKTIKIVVK